MFTFITLISIIISKYFCLFLPILTLCMDHDHHIIISPNSSPNYSISSNIQMPNNSLQQKLQLILHTRPAESWAYSIFWSLSKLFSGNLVFTFRDGYFRGTRDFVPRPCKSVAGSSANVGQLVPTFGFDPDELVANLMDLGEDLKRYG